MGQVYSQRQMRITRSDCLRAAAALSAALAVCLEADPAGAQTLIAAPETSPLAAPASTWETSPYRNFGAAQAVLPGRVLLSDEADGQALSGALAVELRRLSVELFEKQGWRSPLSEGDPLRVYVARKEAGGVRRLATRGIENGRLTQPSIQLDATGLSDREIVREVERLFAYAVLSAYEAPDTGFFTAAAADYIAGVQESPTEREAAQAAAAAPELDLNHSPLGLGRLFVEEIARASGGPVGLRLAWERAQETREEILKVAARYASDASGESFDSIALRFAARLYVTAETESAPSRIGQEDLLTGAFDTAAPAALSVRHRTYLPAEASAAMRVAWPAEGGLGAAVVRYRDAVLPPDVVFLEPGEVRTFPASGVARVDWVVLGGTAKAPSAPAFFERMPEFPFSSLTPNADTSGDGAKLMWTTGSHESLSGWAVFREQLLADGRIVRTGPQIVPATGQSDESMRYAYLDSSASPGSWYRYAVWAVTGDGLLARAFSVTLKTAE
jgi:hypothetical protein